MEQILTLLTIKIILL